MSDLGIRYARLARIVDRADARARRRFSAMLAGRTYSDPAAPETRRYVEAERLIDTLGSPEAILGRRKA